MNLDILEVIAILLISLSYIVVPIAILVGVILIYKKLSSR